MGYPYPQNPAGDPTAVVGRRIGAGAIDLVVYLGIFVALFLAFAESYEGFDDLSCDDLEAINRANVCFESGDDVVAVEDGDAVILYAVPLAATLVLTGLLQGATGASLGKLLCGLRVVRADGRRIGVGRGLLRWLLNVVAGAICCLGIVAEVIVYGVTHPHRSVADRAAGSYVVRKRDAGRPLALPGQWQGGPPPGQWGPPAQPGQGQWGPPPGPPQGPPPGQWGPPPGPPQGPPPGQWGPPPQPGQGQWGPPAGQPWQQPPPSSWGPPPTPGQGW